MVESELIASRRIHSNKFHQRNYSQLCLIENQLSSIDSTDANLNFMFIFGGVNGISDMNPMQFDVVREYFSVFNLHHCFQQINEAFEDAAILHKYLLKIQLLH